jgi:hypothetical protein
VYCGFHSGGSVLIPLFQSVIGDVIVWPGFTSASTHRDRVIAHFTDKKNGLLFKVDLHPGDLGVSIRDYSVFKHENEILIAASSGFRVESVDLEVRGHDSPSIVRFPIVSLSDFLHWFDFDLR